MSLFSQLSDALAGIDREELEGAVSDLLEGKIQRLTAESFLARVKHFASGLLSAAGEWVTDMLLPSENGSKRSVTHHI